MNLARWERLLTPPRQIRDVVVLLAVSGFMLRDGFRADRPITAAIGIAVAGAAWLLITFRPGGATIPTLVACGAAGLWLTAVLPDGSAPAYLIAMSSVAAVALPFARSALLTGVSAVALAVVLTIRHANWTATAAWVASILLVQFIGVARRQRNERAEQQRLLAEERDLAETLAERAYLAREIHDVLAHSLSALAVQLETAAALLERDRAAEAATIVDRAGQLARDGLTEARRAVGTLRGDPIPLAALITELAGGYRQDLGADATLTVDGTPRELPPEAGLVLFRAAQEALANIRKHAPGSSVAIRIAYERGTVTLDVRNGAATAPPLTGLSSGYGLIGLRERAELAGGTAEAGPCDDGWQVDVRIPA